MYDKFCFEIFKEIESTDRSFSFPYDYFSFPDDSAIQHQHMKFFIAFLAFL